MLFISHIDLSFYQYLGQCHRLGYSCGERSWMAKFIHTHCCYHIPHSSGCPSVIKSHSRSFSHAPSTFSLELRLRLEIQISAHAQGNNLNTICLSRFSQLQQKPRPFWAWRTIIVFLWYPSDPATSGILKKDLNFHLGKKSRLWKSLNFNLVPRRN